MSTLYGTHWILTLLLAVPLAGAVACLVGPERRARWTALATTLAALALSLPLFWTFSTGTAEFQNAASFPWIERWGISYAVGLDGISLLMLLLTTVLMPLAVAGSFSQIRQRDRQQQREDPVGAVERAHRQNARLPRIRRAPIMNTRMYVLTRPLCS